MTTEASAEGCDLDCPAYSNTDRDCTCGKRHPATDVPGHDEKCPTCDSPAPHLHPAVQFEGEVQPCSDPFHLRRTPENERYLCDGSCGFAQPHLAGHVTA